MDTENGSIEVVAIPTADEIYRRIKDVSDAEADEVMLAARVLGNVILATEADQHMEQCAQMTQVLPLPYMCLVRGIELGFLMARSTADGKDSPVRFGDDTMGAAQVDQLFIDLRKRKAAIEAARAEVGDKPSKVELPPGKRLILPS